jgi:hypothetical protein
MLALPGALQNLSPDLLLKLGGEYCAGCMLPLSLRPKCWFSA